MFACSFQTEVQSTMTTTQKARKRSALLPGSSQAVQDFNFTSGASDRAEMRRLARFVRLNDLMLLNALREVSPAAGS